MVVINGLLPQRGKFNDLLFEQSSENAYSQRHELWSNMSCWRARNFKHLSKSSNSLPSVENCFSEFKGFSDLCRTARLITLFRGTHHWTLSSVRWIHFAKKINVSVTWSYATGCVVAAEFKNCSALQTSLTARPSTHHHIPEYLNPQLTSVVTSHLPLHTHSFTTQHSV